MTSSNIPPNRDPMMRMVGSLINKVHQLNRILLDQRTATRAFQSNFNNFARNSRDFFRDWRKIVQNPPVTPPGQPPGQPSTQPPGEPQGPSNQNTPQGSRGFMQAFFAAQAQQMGQLVKKMDEVQARAMATNTTLQKMDIPNLGIRMSKLAGEILDLREVGFKNLDISTLRLISTMKLTNQGTQTLQGFLANTSLSLRLNSTQIQEMSGRLSETAVAYGMSQEKMFQAVNSLAESVQTASLLGKGGQTAEALGEVAAMIGDRATRELGIVADFLTGVGNESQSMIAGIFTNYDQFLNATKEEQTQLTLQAVRTFNNTFRSMTAGYGTGASGRRAVAAIAEQFGGMQNVRAFQAVEAALEDASKRTTENTQKLATLKTFEERYANSMERAAASLESIVQKFSSQTVGTAGAVTGGLAAVGAGLGAKFLLKQVAKKLAIGATTGAVAGSVAPGIGNLIGAVVGVGTALWTISDVMGAVKDASQDTANQSAKTNELLDPNKETPQAKRSNTLLDILSTMVQTLNPQADTTSKESLAVQKEMVLQLQAVNTNIATKSLSQPTGFILSR